MNQQEQSPWMCHVCDRKFTHAEVDVCSICYKTTCSLHLKKIPVEKESGIVVLESVCVYCEMGSTA